MSERIYLSQGNGTQVNKEGWKRLQELCPNVLPKLETASNVEDSEIMIGGAYVRDVRFNTWYSAYGVNARGNMRLKDSSNPRFCAHLTNFSKVSIYDNPHYNDIYVDVNDYNMIESPFGISINWDNYNNDSNIVLIDDIAPSYVSSDQSLETSTPIYASTHMDTFGNKRYNLNIPINPYTQETFTFWCNIPLFLRDQDARAYIMTGDKENCISEELKEGEPTLDTSTDYYIKSITYSVSSDKESKNVLGSNNDFFQCNGFKIVGYVTDDIPYNIKLVCERTTLFEIGTYIRHRRGILGEWEEITASQVESLRGWTWSDTVETSTGFIYGSLNTNIPIARNKLVADLIAKNIFSDDMSLKQDKPIKATANYKVGTNIVDQKSDVVENTYRSDGFSTQYIQSSLRDITSILYSDGDVLDALKTSTQVYQNPIDVLVDCYALPFNPTEFVDGAVVSKIHVGNADFDAHGEPFMISRYGKLKTIASTSIDGLLGDFRDYEYITAKLYLPYVATIDFNYKLYMGTVLTIKASFDPRSHTLKYFLFSDGQLIETYSNTIGMDICVTGVDYASKQQGIRNSLSNVLGSSMGLASSIATLNPIGLINSAVNVAEGIYEANNAVNRPSDIKSTGSVGDGTAFNDISYPYIVFDIQETEIPKDLYTLYGKPSNYYGAIGVLSGFTQIDKLRLHSSATAEEQDEIQALCKGGIII